MRVKSSEKRITLSKNVEVEQGSHVVYFYASDNAYMDNLISFIINAKRFNQKVVFIDSQDHYQKLKKLIFPLMSQEEFEGFVQYINNYDFYEMYGDFHFERVLNNFKDTIQPYVNSRTEVRVWGHVDWGKQSEDHELGKELCKYELSADLTLSDLGYITVCAYNGRTVPAYVQTEVLRGHEYFMTDDELVKSHLYKRSSNKVIFPSLSAEKRIESEIDFYKQKLDFIHVVSHEVRNPLTVIKAFAAMLAADSSNESDRARLQVIQDNVEVIDHEIHHIIQTEQMLTTESLWKTQLININDSLMEAINMMKIKAKTQNIHLVFNNEIESNLVVKGNKLAYKLVFSNIISNAIKYSYESQSVFVHTFMKVNKLVFKVEDTGVGMSKAQLEKLFSKYGKMNDEKSGQGIGLFMVKKITDAFDGEIQVKSEVEKGTTVVVEFPLD